MTPDQQIRTAALNAAVAWAEGLPALPEPIIDTARRFEDYIRGPEPEPAAVRGNRGELVVEGQPTSYGNPCNLCQHGYGWHYARTADPQEHCTAPNKTRDGACECPGWNGVRGG